MVIQNKTTSHRYVMEYTCLVHVHVGKMVQSTMQITLLGMVVGEVYFC